MSDAKEVAINIQIQDRIEFLTKKVNELQSLLQKVNDFKLNVGEVVIDKLTLEKYILIDIRLNTFSGTKESTVKAIAVGTKGEKSFDLSDIMPYTEHSRLLYDKK